MIKTQQKEKTKRKEEKEKKKIRSFDLSELTMRYSPLEDSIEHSLILEFVRISEYPRDPLLSRKGERPRSQGNILDDPHDF